MKTSQIAILISTLGLILLLYFLPITAQKKVKTVDENEQTTSEKDLPFDYAAYKKEKLEALAPEILQEIKNLEEVKNKENLLLLNKIYNQHLLYLPACEAILQIAELSQLAEDWEKSGDAYYSASEFVEQKPEIVKYALSLSLNSFEEVAKLQPDNEEVQIRKAAIYLEIGEDVMKGVQILLAIIKEKPNHIQANLILGRYGIISGQFDKAIERLEKVIAQQPKNTEALYFLAEAYFAIGNKEKAIETFELCKKIINNPGFSAEIDMYLEKIKKS